MFLMAVHTVRQYPKLCDSCPSKTSNTPPDNISPYTFRDIHQLDTAALYQPFFDIRIHRRDQTLFHELYELDSRAPLSQILHLAHDSPFRDVANGWPIADQSTPPVFATMQPIGASSRGIREELVTQRPKPSLHVPPK